MKAGVKTIDCTPTWSGLLPVLLELLTVKNEEARLVANDQLKVMARAADAYNVLVKRKAR